MNEEIERLVNEHERSTGGDHGGSPWQLFKHALLSAISRALKERDDRIAVLEKALELPLIFHRSGIWTAGLEARWKEITGTEEATTKVMCDHIRALATEKPHDKAEANLRALAQPEQEKP